jgi:hypothetical protein
MRERLLMPPNMRSANEALFGGMMESQISIGIL